jgi:hypothetical protein
VSKRPDRLLKALHVFIDDHVVTPRVGRDRRPGPSDSELVMLTVAQMLMGFHSPGQGPHGPTYHRLAEVKAN